MTRTRYDLEPGDWAERLEGAPAFRARQVFDGLHRSRRDLEDLTDLPAALRHELSAEFRPALKPVTESVSDGGETVKFLWELDGGARVETVLMHYDRRSTVCLSSQAGCAMACSFCATGQAGFERHLSVGEIVEQFIQASRRAAASDRRLGNVVFMGMGEPLANYDSTWAAIRRLNGPLGLGARHITVSTVGLVPGIVRMADEDLPVNLAVSLHAANDELRDELVPINRTYPLEALERACADYVERTRRRLSFEWAMIDGVNDTRRDAVELAAICRRLRAHVNLIPLNPTPGYRVRGSSGNRVRVFRDELLERGVNVTVRDTRGSEIDAACGQLRAGHDATPVQRPRRRTSRV